MILQRPFKSKSKSFPNPSSPAAKDSSFNLKSFRHFGPPHQPPPSPATSNPSHTFHQHMPTPDLPDPPPLPAARPRVSSGASDSSQRISVAAFREAQTRRSQTSSPVPVFTSSTSSVALDEQRSSVGGDPRPESRNTLKPTPGNRKSKALSSSHSNGDSSSSSSEDSSEENEDNDDLRSRETSRLERRRTITKSSRGHGSRLAHGSGTVQSRPISNYDPTPQRSSSPSVPNKDKKFHNASVSGHDNESIYLQPRGSVSASALGGSQNGAILSMPYVCKKSLILN
jgi:hypothetical protein